MDMRMLRTRSYHSPSRNPGDAKGRISVNCGRIFFHAPRFDFSNLPLGALPVPDWGAIGCRSVHVFFYKHTLFFSSAWVDKESKKIISARKLSRLVVSVAKGNSNYVSKFQLSSSNGLGDIRIFVTKIDDQKGDRFHHLFVENLAPAEIARVQDLSEAKFSKSKKRIKNHFFEVVLFGH